MHKGGVDLDKKKVAIRLEEGELDLLKQKYNTDNQSEAIRLAISSFLCLDILSDSVLLKY